MKQWLIAVGCGVLGAMLVMGAVASISSWWVPRETVVATDGPVVARDGDVGGDIFFPPEPPAGYHWFPAAMVVLNAAGDSLFVCFETGELWQAAPPWCDVVPRE